MIALFFDTETTGVPSADNPDFKPALVQLGCILQDLESGLVLAEVKLIGNQPPGTLIPEPSQKFHGINNSMAARYGVHPDLIDVLLRALIAKANVVVAHNMEYDLKVVAANLPRSAALLEYKQHFCTMVSNLYIVRAPVQDPPKIYYGMTSIPADAPFEPPSLVKTYRHYFNDDFEGAHDAMADIRATRDVLLKMIVDGWFVIGEGEIPGVPVILPSDKYNERISS